MSHRDAWIRIFDIPEYSKHKNGFTIYKVISMLYPESCPDAVSKVTVWKRYNDFKKLRNEINILYQKLNLTDTVPSLPKTSVFKRFDPETIQLRKIGILQFLEYIAKHSQLFMSKVFVKFLEVSHTPVEQLNSNINLIRADLKLPEEPEISFLVPPNSDDDRTMSDSDSVGSINIQSNDTFPDSSIAHNKFTSIKTLRRLPSTQSIDSQSTHSSSRTSNDNCSVAMTTSSSIDAILFSDCPNNVISTPPLTPNSATPQYVTDATMHVNMAIELENDKKYEQAFLAYRTAIDILIKYGKDDTNYDRKQMVKYKTDIYLIRAEKIYNMFLAPEIKELQSLTNVHLDIPKNSNSILNDLYKFKVVKIIASGMLVLHMELQQLFYVKVIHKTMEFLNEHLILPENVPFMVKIHNHYNRENALFLLLDYCGGIKLSDYMKNRSKNDPNHYELLLKQNPQEWSSDNEDTSSDVSYSELVNDYANNRYKNTIDDFEKIDSDEVSPRIKNIMDEPIMQSNLPKSMLDGSSRQNTTTTNSNRSSRRKFSEMSSMSYCEDDHFVTDDEALLLPETLVVKWAAQLLVALEKLHTLGVVCRGLQMKNLIIDDNQNLVLTYMCNVKDLCDLYSNGVNRNLAPEIFSYLQVTEAADWWSYGAILYEMLVGLPLTDTHSNGISCHTRLKLPKYISPEARSLLRQLLVYDPHKRLGNGSHGTDNLKSHPFFSGICWEDLVRCRSY